jgi:hypothetical protein
MTTAPKVGDTVLTICAGPCPVARPIEHEVIQPVSRGRTYLLCGTCGSVTSVPNDQLEVHRD